MSRTDHDRIYSTPGLPRFEIHELDDLLLAGRNPLSAIDAHRSSIWGGLAELNTPPGDYDQ